MALRREMAVVEIHRRSIPTLKQFAAWCDGRAHTVDPKYLESRGVLKRD